MTNSTLKPCPFCGNAHHFRMQAEDCGPDGSPWTAHIECGDCDVVGPDAEHWNATKAEAEAEAITAWNTRTPPTSTDERKDVLEEAADAVVTGLYRRFKDWSARGFGPDDVTWCEVKADIEKLIALTPNPTIDDHGGEGTCGMCGGKKRIPVTTLLSAPDAGWADCPQCTTKGDLDG